MKKWLLTLALACVGQLAPATTNFEFVVIGDTRPRFESENFRTFEALIPKINSAKPAFVINLGDLIYGYGVRRKEKQWDRYEQVIKAFKSPYYQLPGNHDVFSKSAREMYARRFGRFYESFDYGDCHFVLLDNCEEGRWGYLGPKEFDWLKHDLHSTSARAVFVFMHFPVWEPERVALEYHDFWRDTLHPLFRASRVQAVFGGHAHCYGPTREFDGIRYFVSGGGGAELLPDYRRAGGEHHFVKVRVANGSFDVRVVTERGELTDVVADLMGGFLFAEKHSSRIGIVQGSQDLQAGVKFEETLNNPYPVPMLGKAVWEADPRHFTISPGEVTVDIRPGQTAQFAFTLKALRSESPLETLPWLMFDVSAGGRRHSFHRAVLFLQSLHVPFRTEAPSLDGWVKEWTGTPLLSLSGSGSTTAKLQCAHDAKNLYLAVDVPVVKQPLSEDSAFSDQLQLGFAARSGETGFGGETLRLGLKSSGAGVEVGDRTPGHRPGAALPGVKAASRTADGRTVFEVLIPKKLLPSLSGAAKGRLVLSVSFPVPEQGEGEPMAPKPGTFAYQIRYGGDALVPVHFVELVLGKQP